MTIRSAASGVVSRRRTGAAGAMLLGAIGVAAPGGFGLQTDDARTFNYVHQQDRRVPDYGMVLAQRPGSLIAEPASEYGVPRSNFLGYDTARAQSRAAILTERYQRRVSPR